MSASRAARTARVLAAVDGGLCAYGCGRQADHGDHVMPRSRGGRDRVRVPACADCGQRKGDLTVVEWIAAEVAAANPTGWRLALLRWRRRRAPWPSYSRPQPAASRAGVLPPTRPQMLADLPGAVRS